MRQLLPPSIQQSALDSRRIYDDLTHVELTIVPKKVEHWLRFGDPIERTVINRIRTVASFKPGQVFAFVRWACRNNETIISRLDIVRTVDRGEAYQTLPFVRPGGEILLRVDNWSKVEKVFQAIDAIQSIGIYPPDVSPAYWRHVHNRLAANQEPRQYSQTQHRAWRLCAKVKP
jgi:hypothetical protein